MPDVELARREGIELVRTGSWSAASGSWQPTREDILSAVKATECPAVRRIRLKLGHFDPRFNSGGDGEPALGWFENLRATDGGNTLVGDQVALPWLSSVQAAAYPDRSIEGTYRYRCGLSHEHPFVITAVALLGVTPPAVSALRSVQDLPEMLGVAAAEVDPDNGEHVSVTVAAGQPEAVAAGAGNGGIRMSLAQRIRDAWNASGAPFTQWVQEVRANAAVVVDDADRSHRLVPVTFDGGKVLFGVPAPYDPESDRPVVFASRAESRPEPEPAEPLDTEPSPGIDQPPAEPLKPPTEAASSNLPAAEPEQEINPDPKEDLVSTELSGIRSRLGLADDADEQTILSALDELKTKADTPAVAEPTPEMVAASAAATEKAKQAEAEKDELRKEVQVLASQMQQVTTELSATKAAQAATVKASVFDAAIKDGKLKPADREQWEKDYDEAPGAITRVLASIAPGTAVPVMASGVVGDAEPGGSDSEWDDLVSRLDGPSAKAV